MKGTIHYSKHGHVQIVGEDNRVYYTGISLRDCAFPNRSVVEFDIIDNNLSKAGNCRIATKEK